MTGYVGRANRGVYDDAHGLKAQDERVDMHVSLPAEVVDFDPGKQTATLKVLWKPRFGDKEVDFPNLLEVPVDQPRGGGGFAVTFPIQKGDQGIVRFSGRDQDNWYLDDGAQPLNTDRLNSFSDGVFYPGLHSQKRAMANYDADNLYFGTDDHKNGLRVTPQGTVALEGAGESLFQILSELLATLEADSLIIKYGSSAGTGHQLEFRAKYGELLGRLNTMKFR